jgi:hypothetical protein
VQGGRELDGDHVRRLLLALLLLLLCWLLWLLPLLWGMVALLCLGRQLALLLGWRHRLGCHWLGSRHYTLQLPRRLLLEFPGRLRLPLLLGWLLGLGLGLQMLPLRLLGL